MPDAERGEHAGRYQREIKADAEANHQHEADAQLLELHADQQHGDGRRAWDQVNRP